MTKLIVVFFIYSLTIQWATADNQKVAIASAHPLATAAGFEVLAKGGNVPPDPAVTLPFRLGTLKLAPEPPHV